MTSLTVSTVAGWRPGELTAVADRLVAAAAAVDDDARAVRRHLGDAVDDAGGAWATTAASRAAQEARHGHALADAMTAAAAALRDGVARLDQARQALLDAVGRAQAAGLEVTPAGRVPSPTSVAPLEQLGHSPEQRETAQESAHRAAAHRAEVAEALAAVVATDQAVADSVRGLDFPRTLPALLAAHEARTRLLGGDRVAALGTAGGVVVVGKAAHDVHSLVSSGRLLHDYASLARQGAPRPELERARRAFAYGTAHNPALKILGRVALPMTFVEGVQDAQDGNGYDGARGWATRGFGAAGAAGAVVVAGGAFLAPGLVVAGGAAVLAYGAWSAGNYVVDHWDQVEDAWQAADDWVDTQQAEAAEEVGEAVDWAHDRLADAGSGALDALGGLF